MTARISASARFHTQHLIRGLTAAFLLALAAFAPVNAAEPAVAPATAVSKRSPEPIHRVSPQHPAELRRQLVNGEAVVEGLVGIDGRMADATVASATHPEFGEAAAAAARQWEFRPGEVDGQPVVMRVRIPFAFQLSAHEMIEALVGRPLYVDVGEAIIPAEQLPTWPLPKKYQEPRYPKELQGSGKRGKAIVAIVINKEGRVINPKVVKSTHPEFMLPALMAAVALEFSPQITANKEAAFVSMEIQYDFSAERAKSQPAEPDKDHPPAKKKTG